MKLGLLAALASKCFWVATFRPNTGSSFVLGLPMSEPNSDGRKRFTPAATAASMTSGWPLKPSVPTRDTTASCPLNAVVRDSRESKLTLATFTEAGNVAFEVSRVRAVMLNFPESIRAFKTGCPRVPDALKILVPIYQVLGRETYASDCDILDGNHFKYV